MLNITQTNKEAAFLQVMKIDKSVWTFVTLSSFIRFKQLALYSEFASSPTNNSVVENFGCLHFGKLIWFIAELKKGYYYYYYYYFGNSLYGILLTKGPVRSEKGRGGVGGEERASFLHLNQCMTETFRTNSNRNQNDLCTRDLRSSRKIWSVSPWLFQTLSKNEEEK